MEYIKRREAELLIDREKWVRNRISELKNAREEIEARLAEGTRTAKLQFTGLPVGYVDEIVKELQSWYLAEPSEHGKVELYVAHADRINTDYIVVRLV